MKILALHLLNFIEYANLRGVPKEEFENPALLSENKFNESASVAVDDFIRVIKLLAQKLNDPLLGIRMGNFMNIKSLGLIYQISLAASTVEEALFYLKDYIKGTFPIIDIQTEMAEGAGTISLELKGIERKIKKVILENVMTIISRELIVMGGREMTVQLFSPYYIEGYPVEWGKGDTFTIKFKNLILSKKLKGSNRWQLDILVPAYLKMIEVLRAEKSFANDVRITILSMANPQLPELKEVADTFNMSPRTFQRQLDTEHVSFRQITNDLKKEISLLFIRHHNFSISDISLVLGYSEPASFIHSFKKWHGNTPDKMRKETNTKTSLANGR